MVVNKSDFNLVDRVFYPRNILPKQKLTKQNLTKQKLTKQNNMKILTRFIFMMDIQDQK